MAIVKSIAAGVLGLSGMGLVVVGALEAPGPPPRRVVPVPEVAVRPVGVTAAAAETAVKAPEAVPAVEPDSPEALAPPDAGAPAPEVKKRPAGEGLLTLEASASADVFVDGKKVGTAPVAGLKVRAGAHRVRFDCYDESGSLTQGKTRTVTVAANQEQTVSHTCPAAE